MVVSVTYLLKIENEKQEQIVDKLHKMGIEHIHGSADPDLIFNSYFINLEKAESFKQNVKDIDGVIEVDLIGPYFLISSRSIARLYK